MNFQYPSKLFFRGFEDDLFKLSFFNIFITFHVTLVTLYREIHHLILEVLKMSNKKKFEEEDEREIVALQKEELSKVFCLEAKCVLII